VPSDQNYEVGTLDIHSLVLENEQQQSSASTVQFAHYKIRLKKRLSEDNSRYQGGRIFIGTSTYKIISNNHIDSYSEWVVIQDDGDYQHGHLAAQLAHPAWPEGMTFLIRDDDHLHTQPAYANLPNFNLITPVIWTKFVPAYIQLETNVHNPNKTVPFAFNFNPASMAAGKDVASSMAYWACRVITAFQPETWEDNVFRQRHTRFHQGLQRRFPDLSRNDPR
jgi:hypothetical protein